MHKIPKIIHYCWFGNHPMPSLTLRCIESWKKYLPDYKIILWNENTIDINSNKFIKQAYDSKKYAFVSDYVRLYVLYKYGGIYMDTDVEVIKNLDRFLVHSAFTGFEDQNLISTGIMGSTKGHPWVKKILEYYNDISFIENGQMNLIPNTIIITNISKEEFDLVPNNQYQVLKNDVVIYPNDFFCPKHWASKKIVLSENTYTIHHFAGSWVPKRMKAEGKLKFYIKKLIGEPYYDRLRKIKKKLFN